MNSSRCPSGRTQNLERMLKRENDAGDRKLKLESMVTTKLQRKFGG